MERDKSPKPEPPPADKPRKELPVVSVPDDRAMMDEEMADLFDEDRVRHEHGSAEPEAD
jgi:hypothetical protein